MTGFVVDLPVIVGVDPVGVVDEVGREHEALLRRLDGSLRWCERRARAAHRGVRAGERLLQGLAHYGAIWGMVPNDASLWAADDRGWCGGAPDTDNAG